jgi:hypothetical protein
MLTRQTNPNQYTGLVASNRGRSSGRPAGRPPGPQPTGGTLGTSINPTGIYPQDFTRQAGNLAAALAIPGRADLMAQHGMPGVSSYSPMTQWGIGADYAGALAQSMMAPQQIAQQHGFANAQNVLQGQQAREQEALGWGRIGLQNQNNLLAMLAHIV